MDPAGSEPSTGAGAAAAEKADTFDSSRIGRENDALLGWGRSGGASNMIPSTVGRGKGGGSKLTGGAGERGGTANYTEGPLGSGARSRMASYDSATTLGLPRCVHVPLGCVANYGCLPQRAPIGHHLSVVLLLCLYWRALQSAPWDTKLMVGLDIIARAEGVHGRDGTGCGTKPTVHLVQNPGGPSFVLCHDAAGSCLRCCLQGPQIIDSLSSILTSSDYQAYPALKTLLLLLLLPPPPSLPQFFCRTAAFVRCRAIDGCPAECG